MVSLLAVLAKVPWLKLINAAGIMKGLHESMKSRPQKPPAQGAANAADIPTSHTDVTELQKRLGTVEVDVTELQERLGTVEANEETQAELTGQMIRHEEALLRRLIVLTLASAVTGAVAIAALVIAVLR